MWWLSFRILLQRSWWWLCVLWHILSGTADILKMQLRLRQHNWITLSCSGERSSQVFIVRRAPRCFWKFTHRPTSIGRGQYGYSCVSVVHYRWWHAHLHAHFDYSLLATYGVKWKLIDKHRRLCDWQDSQKSSCFCNSALGGSHVWFVRIVSFKLGRQRYCIVLFCITKFVFRVRWISVERCAAEWQQLELNIRVTIHINSDDWRIFQCGFSRSRIGLDGVTKHAHDQSPFILARKRF